MVSLRRQRCGGDLSRGVVLEAGPWGFMRPVMVLGAVHDVSMLVTLRIFAIGRSGPVVLR